jgi:hypothetical protein
LGELQRLILEITTPSIYSHGKWIVPLKPLLTLIIDKLFSYRYALGLVTSAMFWMVFRKRPGNVGVRKSAEW